MTYPLKLTASTKSTKNSGEDTLYSDLKPISLSEKPVSVKMSYFESSFNKQKTTKYFLIIYSLIIGLAQKLTWHLFKKPCENPSSLASSLIALQLQSKKLSSWSISTPVNSLGLENALFLISEIR